MKEENKEKVITTNRKANFEYHIEETFESGIVLKGTEIKAMRSQGCQIQDSFVKVEDQEAWLYRMEIPQYKYGNIENHDPTRKRKLLLHHREIIRIQSEIERKSVTCVPLKVYLKRGKAKVLLGLGTGKKNYDKRESIKKRESERQIQKIMKSVNR